MADVYRMTSGRPVSARDVDVRATFVMRTYTHLFGAIVGFVFLCFAVLGADFFAGFFA